MTASQKANLVAAFGKIRKRKTKPFVLPRRPSEKSRASEPMEVWVVAVTYGVGDEPSSWQLMREDGHPDTPKTLGVFLTIADAT